MHPRSAHAPSKTSLFKITLAAVAAAVLLALLPGGVADAREPRIEGFPNYHPQTTCSPKPKRGTVMLANYLMRHYRGSGSLGISRSCRASGVSEHKEGRAFDWALNAKSRRDRRYAADFLHRLRKTDRFGNRDALARRMGIMYAIWNDHIYSATHHYRTRRYKHPACRTIRRCSVSLRHRNHMHISLTRPAARTKTSWYARQGKASPHKAKPKRPHRKKHASHHKARHHHKARPHKARHPKARHHKARHPKARHHTARHRHKAKHHAHRHKASHHKARHHKTRHHKARHHKTRHRHKARHHRHRAHHKARPHKARGHNHRRHHRRHHRR